MDAEQILGPSMVEIDGGKARSLREAKGLTQLYVATRVGVTTDTISRWEHRRYPAIKKENALRLAEALEVELKEILQFSEPISEVAAEPEPPSPAAGEKAGAPAGPRRRSWFVWTGLALSTLLVGFLVWWRLTPEPGPQIFAQRILPRHSPPGSSFPVLIHLDALPAESFLILRERIPEGASLLQAVPAPVTADSGAEELKWIGRSKDGRLTFAYRLRAGKELELGAELRFQGTVTLQQGGRGATRVAESAFLEIAPFHWADANSDGQIDDDEILTVYNNFGDYEELKVDIDLIEDIWSGGGYEWEKRKQQFVVKP